MRVVKRKINDSTIATPFEGSQPRDFDQSRYTYFLVYALYSPTPRRPSLSSVVKEMKNISLPKRLERIKDGVPRTLYIIYRHDLIFKIGKYHKAENNKVTNGGNETKQKSWQTKIRNKTKSGTLFKIKYKTKYAI